jgi:glycosyltransferase involved in cell wall biosynthesis
MLSQAAPRVAVLIPAYNAHRSIATALTSLAASNEPYDVIVVDDGSTLPLEAMLPPRSNMRILRLDQNVGIAGALNHGLHYILGHGYEYVARLDSDDVVLPERLAIQRAFLDEHPDIAAVGSWGEVVSEQGAPVFYLNHPTDYQQILRKLHHNNCFLHPSLMLRTNIFREAGVYSENYPSAEDYELMCRLARRYQLANLPRYLIRYTLTGSGISLSKRRQQLESRLKIQWKYRDFGAPDFYLGLLRTIILRFVAVRFIMSIKQKHGGYRRLPVGVASAGGTPSDRHA